MQASLLQVLLEERHYSGPSHVYSATCTDLLEIIRLFLLTNQAGLRTRLRSLTVGISELRTAFAYCVLVSHRHYIAAQVIVSNDNGLC